MSDAADGAKAKEWRAKRAAQMQAFFDTAQAEMGVLRLVLQLVLVQLAKEGGPEGLQALRDDTLALISTRKSSDDPATNEKAKMLMEGICQQFFSQIAAGAGFSEETDEAAN